MQLYNPNTQRALNLIQEYLGVPYVWGGETPKGFDCSGLLQYVWGKVGVKIPRVTYDQYKAGMVIGKNQLKPGDAVFFRGSDPKGGLPGHVGMYIGNGKFIEAPGRGKKVRVSLLASRKDYVGARRYSGTGAPLDLAAISKEAPSGGQPVGAQAPDLPPMMAEPQFAAGPPDPSSTVASVMAPGTLQADAQTPNKMADTWQLLSQDPLAQPETQALAKRLQGITPSAA